MSLLLLSCHCILNYLFRAVHLKSESGKFQKCIPAVKSDEVPGLGFLLHWCRTFVFLSTHLRPRLILFQQEERQMKYFFLPHVKLPHLITQDLIKPLLPPEYNRTNGCTILGCIRKCASILCWTFNRECWESLQDATRPAL